MSSRIRNRLERADWAFIREVCAWTGKAGEPIERSRWRFFAEQWVGPYERLRPEWAYVAEDAGGSQGYLTGCPDSARFQCEKRWLFDFPLLLRVAAGAYVPTSDVERFKSRFFERDGPEDRFPRAATAAILDEYPAHLHLNLVESARGKGVGGRLIDRYREDLATAGVRGIHLYCGPKPLAFYRRAGFGLLDQVEFRPGIPVYRLGSRF